MEEVYFLDQWLCRLYMINVYACVGWFLLQGCYPFSPFRGSHQEIAGWSWCSCREGRWQSVCQNSRVLDSQRTVDGLLKNHCPFNDSMRREERRSRGTPSTCFLVLVPFFAPGWVFVRLLMLRNICWQNGWLFSVFLPDVRARCPRFGGVFRLLQAAATRHFPKALVTKSSWENVPRRRGPPGSPVGYGLPSSMFLGRSVRFTFVIYVWFFLSLGRPLEQLLWWCPSSHLEIVNAGQTNNMSTGPKAQCHEAKVMEHAVKLKEHNPAVAYLGLRSRFTINRMIKSFNICSVYTIALHVWSCAFQFFSTKLPENLYLISSGAWYSPQDARPYCSLCRVAVPCNSGLGQKHRWMMMQGLPYRS